MSQQDSTGRRTAGRRLRRSVPALLTAGIAALLAFGVTRAKQAGETHTVEIEGFAFVPDTVHAAPGDTIVWINRDVVPHTATAGGWDSGVMNTAAEWRMVVGSKGDVAYLCALHPAMKGTLIVR